MYLDTVTYNPPAVRMVLDWIGPDHVVYGSDAPPLTSLKPRAIKLIKDLDIPEPQREAVFWRNAAKLLKLPTRPPPPPHDWKLSLNRYLSAPRRVACRAPLGAPALRIDGSAGIPNFRANSTARISRARAPTPRRTPRRHVGEQQ